MADSLTKLDQATRMLAEVRNIDDAKDLINLAEAARVYAKQVELGLEAQNHAAEIKLRAQRKAGEILDKIEFSKGAATPLHDVTALTKSTTSGRIMATGVTASIDSITVCLYLPAFGPPVMRRPSQARVGR